MVRFVAMQEQPVAARTAEPGKWVEDGLTAQQRFERERARTVSAHRTPLTLLQRLAGAVVRRGTRADAAAAAVPRHLEGLEQAGCVVLHDVRTLIGGARTEHLVVAPAGIYTVEVRPWRGQVAVVRDELYVDGRLRSGVPESLHKTASAVQRALAEELAPVGASVSPVLCLVSNESSWRAWKVQEVTVVTGRGLARHLRQAPPVMGRDTIVRVALAADRLLENDPRPTRT
jgi:hypothetical protein